MGVVVVFAARTKVWARAMYRRQEQDALLSPRLVDKIDQRHELRKRAALIDWEVFGRD